MAPPRVTHACLVVVMLLLAAGAESDESASTLEYPVKAAFLYEFARFVEWPDVGAAAGPLCIGVLGDDPFGETLDRAVIGKKAGGRALEVRRFRNLEELSPCAILFVTTSEIRRLDAVLTKTAGWPTLTVGEHDGFTGSGGMVRFFVDGNRVRFEVNLRAAENAGLRLSSRMLAIASVTGRQKAGSR
jgi:hypothetical protein